MLTPSRKSLTKTRLNNLIMLRVNVPILKTLDPQYEEKLIARAVATYVRGKYHKTKSKAYTFESAHSDLLFLSEKESEYLSDDGHLIFSDSEEEEEENDENGEINDGTEDVDDGILDDTPEVELLIDADADEI